MKRVSAVIRVEGFRRSLASAVTLGAVLAPLATAGPRAHPAHAAVPQRFIGVNVDGPMLTLNSLDLEAQFAMMGASGVRSVRVAFYWASAQPYSNWAHVPVAKAKQFVDVDGLPTTFALTDEVVGDAARAHMTVLPVVVGTPPWDARVNLHGESTPARSAPYVRYLTALVRRYGPRGTYWDGHVPSLPIRTWQVWNEPNIPFYWPQPFATSYIALLRAAHRAVKRADPGAQIVLGALTNFSWRSLRQIYRVRGASRTFDVIALDPYTRTPQGVIDILKLVRRTADTFGDSDKPLMASEVGWTSARGHPCRLFNWDTTASGQAQRVAAVLPKLAMNRKPLRLLSVYYYTWMGDESQETYDFNFAGLLRFRTGGIVAKPALRAFAAAALGLER